MTKTEVGVLHPPSSSPHPSSPPTTSNEHHHPTLFGPKKWKKINFGRKVGLPLGLKIYFSTDTLSPSSGALSFGTDGTQIQILGVTFKVQFLPQIWTSFPNTKNQCFLTKFWKPCQTLPLTSFFFHFPRSHFCFCLLSGAVFLCMCMCLCLCACVCVCVHVFVSVCMCLCLFACVCVCVHVFVSVCLCLCLSCVCVLVFVHSGPRNKSVGLEKWWRQRFTKETLGSQ